MFKNEKLKNIRIQNEKTQEEVARYLGVTQGSYGHFEAGRRRPSKEIVEKLCDLFGVQEAYFYDEKIDKVRELIDNLKSQGIIKDAEDIKDDVAQLILDAVKTEVRLNKLKKGQGN